MFLQCTNRDFVKFSGTGFRTITMFSGYDGHNSNDVVKAQLFKILQNAENYLAELKKSHKPSSMTI
jgi:hypothetical protein